MDRGDHARADVVTGGLSDELANRLPCSTTELAEQLAAMKEVGSQEPRYRENPQAVIRFLDDLILFPVKPLNPEKPWLSWQGMADPVLIEQSAIQLADWTKHRGERLIALPLVGCGNGGLGEEVVLPILHYHLSASRFILVRQGD